MTTMKLLEQLGFNDEQIEFLLCNECKEDFPDETPKDIALRTMEFLTHQYRLALSILEQ